MAFYIRSTDPDRPENGYSYWSEDGTPRTMSAISSPAKGYSTESEAQSFIDSYKTNWIGFQKSIGLTFTVVEE